jgi:hypothetical protein
MAKNHPRRGRKNQLGEGLRESIYRLQLFIEHAQSADVRTAASATDARFSLQPLLFSLPGWKQPGDFKTFDAVQVRDEAMKVLRSAIAGERFQIELRLVRQAWRDPRIKKGLLLSTSSEHTRDFVLFRLLTLLENVGIDRLRTCPARNCGHVFFRTTRKEFCSTRCQKREWQRIDRSRK